MDVNDIFTQLGNFWDRISTPILFHIIFFFLFVFLFGKVSIKSAIENYIQSSGFHRTKAILTEFELWKKLPLILIILTLIYLTLFNSVTGLLGSTGVFPFNTTYSNQDFLKEYRPRESILEIAKYGKDTVPDLFKVEQLKEKLLEEYKGKYPDKHSTWVKWTQEQYATRIRNFNLTALTVITLFVILVIRTFQKKRLGKVRSIFKFILVLIVVSPLLFLLRYRVEQSVEEQFANEIVFVKSSLEIDESRKIILDSVGILAVEKRLIRDLEDGIIHEPQLWVSRIVGQHQILQTLLGNRKLQNIVSRNDDYHSD